MSITSTGIAAEHACRKSFVRLACANLVVDNQNLGQVVDTVAKASVPMA
jgi:hypothetical protein